MVRAELRLPSAPRPSARASRSGGEGWSCGLSGRAGTLKQSLLAPASTTSLRRSREGTAPSAAADVAVRQRWREVQQDYRRPQSRVGGLEVAEHRLPQAGQQRVHEPLG